MSDQGDPIPDDLERQATLLMDAPMVGVGAEAFLPRIFDLWAKGLPPGTRTGWQNVDELYTVAPGQLTIVTGWPGSGKSEWLDALLLNIARQDWRICLHSPENRPEEIHVVKYLEKFTGKPFGEGVNERLTESEVAEAVHCIKDWFGFLVASADAEQSTFNIEQIMGAAELWFRMKGYWRKKPCGLVIDPWNELDHQRPSHWSETEYVSATLTALRSWARTHGVHVWVVAHPQKLPRDQKGELPVPRPDTISGSQHWWNKADNCVTVWRDYDNRDAPVQVHVQKVRFKHIGKIGMAKLDYDRVTGQYRMHREPGEYYGPREVRRA